VITAAATTQQAIGTALIATVLIGLAIYMIAENRVSKESNLESFLNAPNRKAAPNDEIFEGPRLDRFLSWALVLMTIVAISVPLYWLGEVGRQTGAIRGFDKRSVHRGEEAYYNQPNTREGTPALNCAKCHGANAGGGAVQFAVKDYDKNGMPIKIDGKDAIRQVQWMAPRINDVALRYRKGQLYNVLVYGRPPTPMPAWGIKGGGPSTDQTIYDVINYLRHIALEKNEEARKLYEEQWDKTKDADKSYEFVLDSLPVKKARQEESIKALAEAKKSKANAGKSDGQLLFEMNCARCHVTGYSQGEAGDYTSGAFGPSLNKTGLKYRFPAASEQAAFIAKGTESDNKPYGTRGINHWAAGGMPYFENVLTAKQIDAIVEYERQFETGQTGEVPATQSAAAEKSAAPEQAKSKAKAAAESKIKKVSK
jgi:mono/diheme cytochrome c family protein